jgi:NitT/TauT family transport system ATP-binding protein
MLAEAPVQPETAASSLVRLHGVGHRFDAGDRSVLAIEGVDLDLRAGELLAVVGESGCGKSTLLRLVAGLLEPTTGQVELDGQPLRGVSPAVAMVFQKPVLLDWRTVLENVLLPLELAGQQSESHQPAHGQARALALLEALGLADFAQHRPRQLSGGMQQRAALARALLTEPRVLLLDEPFSALDALTREQLQLELSAAWSASGATAMLVTHDIAEAVFLADRVALMTPRPGRVARIVEVPLPRPRAPELRYGPEFGALCRQLREGLEALRDAP